MKKKAYRRKSFRGKGRLVKLIRSVSLKNTETKYNQHGAENIQLQHNGGISNRVAFADGGGIINALKTSQGTGQNQRLGDEVFVKGIKFKFWLANKSDRTNVTYRIIVYTAPKDTYAAGAPANFWEGTVGNKLLDKINTDKYKILRQRMVYVGGEQRAQTVTDSGVVGKEHTRLVSMWIPMKNKRIKYESDGGEIPMYSQNIIQVGVLAYDAFGTLTTDNIASFAYTSTMYFKDP